MPGSIQNKLQQFEVAPPSSVWDKISAQLDNEFVAGDLDISQKLDNASIDPPSGVWDKIDAELHGEVNIAPRAKVIPLIYKRIAAAALIAGVLIIGGLYFLNKENAQSEIVQTTPAKKETPAATQPIPPAVAQVTPPLIAERIPGAVAVRKIENRSTRKNNIQHVDVTYNNDDLLPDPEQAPLYELNTVSALQPVSVSAPLLRDKKGNIIMDASLISHPDDKYITVTGPNGKQTKISSKFLSCLSYINASITSNDMDPKALRCKAQFEEWRNKLIDQPAFIPTANNFFDIFELKDMIQDM